MGTTIGTQVKSKPFIYLWDVASTFSAGSGSVQRIYNALAAEKLLMAHIWFVAPSAGKTFTFYKGLNLLTTAISHQFSSTDVGQLTDDSLAFDETQPHLEMLIGGDVSEDLMITTTSAAWTLTMHVKLFFEE